MDSNLISSLRNDYRFDCVNDLPSYLVKPINALYVTLASAKKEVFSPTDRIIFYSDATLPQDLINHMQKMITHLNIPNFCVLVISNCGLIKDQLQFAHDKFSGDPELIQIKIVDTKTKDLPESKWTDFAIPTNICVMPWINISTTNSGRYQPCCVYGGVVPGMNVSDNSLSEVFNGSYIRNIREKFLANEIPAGCTTCFAREKIGANSPRLNSMYVHRNIVNLIDWHSPTQEIKTLDVKLGYTCNLSCRICGPNNSSAWASEAASTPLVAKRYPIMIHRAGWIKDTDSAFWSDFSAIKNSVTHIDLSGGEPFLIKQHLLMLRYLIDNGAAKDIKLHYNTNGTIFPHTAIDLWREFREIEVTFSIDNLGDRFEYERYGVEWGVVTSTIAQFQMLAMSNLILNIFCVVSILNVCDTPAVFDFGRSLKIPVTFDILVNPAEFSFNVLTASAKQHILDILLLRTDSAASDKISPLIRELQQCKNTVPIEKFWETINLIDSSRNQNFSEFYPTLNKLLKEN